MSLVKAPSLSPGGMLASRWIVGGLLGHSEFAEVYEAEEAREGRFAAFKLLSPTLGADEPWQKHVALLRALAELPGDGLARTYDAGIEPSLARPFIASERLIFPTLSRYVQERGPLPLRTLAAALDTIAAALDTAHGAGFVHGNLKLQNVFVSFDNPRWARITDFALGQLRVATGAGPAALLGWTAPELASGPPTAASDRYSLALVCFFAATGGPWYSALRYGETASDGDRPSHVASERARAFGGELPDDFDPWFARALALDPGERFASAAEMAQSFVELLSVSRFPPPASSAHPLSATRPIRDSQIPKFAPAPAAQAPLRASQPPSSFESMATVPVAQVNPEFASTLPMRESHPPRSPSLAPKSVAPLGSQPPAAKLPVARNLLLPLATAAIVAIAILAMWWALR